MRWKGSWCHQDSNAVNESSWDAHGVEMVACAMFKHFAGSWILPGSHSGISWLRHTSFRDVHGVEIGACANFDVFFRLWEIIPSPNKL